MVPPSIIPRIGDPAGEALGAAEYRTVCRFGKTGKQFGRRRVENAFAADKDSDAGPLLRQLELGQDTLGTQSKQSRKLGLGEAGTFSMSAKSIGAQRHSAAA